MKNQTLTIRTGLQTALMVLAISFMSILSVAPVAADTIDNGSWTKKQYKIKGGWEIVQSGGETVIRFNNKFKTKGGPDLKVFLSKKSISDVNGKNAVEDSVMVSVLKSNKGTQDYVLPADIDLNDFKSLLIHCEAYSVLWGGANI